MKSFRFFIRPVAKLAALATIAGLTCLSVPSFAAQNISFWTLGMKPKFTPYFANMVKQYEAQHQGVKIEWTDYPYEVMQAKLASAIGAGKPPSLVNLNVPWAEEYARKGLLQSVDGIIEPALYAAQAIEDLRFQGKVYGFPHYNNVNVLAYNKALFQQAGIATPPKSLAEMLTVAQQIAAKTGQAGLAPPLGKIDNYFLQYGLPVLKDGRAAFNTAEHAAFLDQFALAYKNKALLKDGLFAENNFSHVINAYNSKRLAMMLGATTVIKRVQQDAPSTFAQTGIAAAPLGPTGIADGGWLFHFAVPTGVPAASMPEVGKFARFLTNDANQLAFAKLAGVFPSAAKAAQDPSFAKLGAAANSNPADQAVSVAAGSVQHARTLYVAGVRDYEQLQRALVKACEAAVTGKMPSRQALSLAAAIWDKQLAKNQLANAAKR